MTLDPSENYEDTPIEAILTVPLNRVSKDLDENDQSSIVKELLKEAKRGNQEPSRADLLIQASANTGPPSEEILAFWDTHCHTEDGFTPLTIEALVKNGTKPALNFLEKKMREEDHKKYEKMTWIVPSIMKHRNDQPLLETCDSLLHSDIYIELRLLLVDALFDYQPEIWFRPATIEEPPSRQAAPTEALKKLQEIGEQTVIHLPLKENQKRAVKKTLEEVKMILTHRIDK